ncbi:MAG: hypothetical protein Q9208_006907 [Pyrenodesmia sp. 3 TL-2023]
MYSVTLDRLYLVHDLSAALPYAMSIGFRIEDMPADSPFLRPVYEYLKWITVNQALAWCSVIAVKFSFLFLFRKLIDRLPRLITYWWFVLQVLYIPVNLIWKIQIRWTQKVPLVLSLCLTAIIILVTITRIAGIEKGGQVDGVWESYFLIVAAEVGIILASVSTYRTLFVSHRRGDRAKAKRDLKDQEHFYSPTRELIRRVLIPSPWRSKAREPSTPHENKEHHYHYVDVEALPEIPRAYMTGVRTFINGRVVGADDADVMGSQMTQDDDDDWPLRKEDNISEEEAVGKKMAL